MTPFSELVWEVAVSFGRRLAPSTALSPEHACVAIRLDERILSGGDSRVLPLLRSLGSEEPKGPSGDQMTLEIEGIADGGMNARKRCADIGDLKRCILCSRRRIAGCEFSARLLWRMPCSWRAEGPSSRRAAA